MNKILMEHIIRHIFSNFAILPNTFINFDKTKSLMSKEFVLNDTLKFESENGIVNNKIWGCQFLTDQQEVKILLGDCNRNDFGIEYCLIVQLKDSPAYGVYLVCNSDDSEPLIACTLNGEEWLECNTYLQATFLAGMEHIKDIGVSWSKCFSYKDQYDLMISFIDFHDKVYEENYEG